MKTIDAALTTAQKDGAGAAIALASLADAGRLHLTQFTVTPQSGKIVALNTTTEIVRAQATAANKLQVQRITDPNTAANWGSWTELEASGVLSTIPPALFYDGTYLVVSWVATGVDPKPIKWRRSSDGGLNWSASQTIVTADTPTHIAGVTDSAGVRDGLLYSQTTPLQISFITYAGSTDTWGAANSNTIGATSIQDLDGAWDSANSRYLVPICANAYASWAGISVVMLTLSSGGTWGGGRIIFPAAGDGQYNKVTLSQGKTNSLWWMTFLRELNPNAGHMALACSDDGDYWELNIAFAEAAYLDKEHMIGTLAGYAWVAGAHAHRSATQSFWSSRQATHYQMDLRGEVGRVTCTIDNTDGTITAAEPTRQSVLTLNRGLTVAGVAYPVSAGRFYVINHHFIMDDELVIVEAVDAIGLLNLWRADQTWRWDGERLDVLAQLVCALAGVHTVTFDAATVWADTIAVFSINIGTSGLAALRSLSSRANFDVIVQEDGSIKCFVATAAPASQYTYGRTSGLHKYWPGVFGRGFSPDYIAVYGNDDDDVAEAIDYTAERDAGFRRPRAINDRRVIGGTDADELADARLVLAKEYKKVGKFQSPPNFALEPGDIVTISEGWANTNGPWRCTGFMEEMNPHKRERTFYQEVELRGTA